MDATKIIAWLPFDESATLDRCGNSWTAYNSPTVSNTNAVKGNALQLSGGNYVMCDSLTIGGQDFTIHGYCYMNSSSGKWARIFEMPQTDAKDTNILFLGKYEGSTNWTLTVNGTRANFAGTFDQLIHFEVDYQHDTATTKCFINGELKATLANQTIARVARKIRLGKSSWNADGMFVGSIDEFMILDGVALHTASFTPPTAAEYEELAFQLDSHVSFTIDVERRISNVVEFTADVERKVITAWRYYNPGTADTLTVTGTTLTDLPETKSVTGTAFYQTAGEKCFDLPTTDEVWLKFDVYFNGSNRWRAYNGGTNGVTGITAWNTSNPSPNALAFFSNSNTEIDLPNFSAVCKTNTLQTVLLHMISGATAGVIEAWVDGAKIYTYTGDVNHGQDFADIYLQSDGAGTFFSNVIISNKRLTQADGYQKFTADVERVVKNVFSVDFSVDVVRLLNLEMVADEFLHNLTAWLTFDETQTFDVKLNTWTAYGDLTISETGAISGKALQFNGRGFVVMSETIKFWQRQPFAIGCWFSGTSGKQNAATDATLWILHALDSRADIYVGIDADGILWLVVHHFNVGTSKSILDGKKHYVEVDFDGFAFYLFVDGVLIGELRNIYFSPEREYQLYVGGMSISDPRYAYLFKMTLDEFIFLHNVALHTEDFSPPTSADYDFYKSIPISTSFCFYADVERKIIAQCNIEFSADTVIYDVLPVNFAADVIVCDALPANFDADVEILDVMSVEFAADINRAIKAKLRLFAIDTAGYFSGGTRRNLLRDNASPEAVIIPSETIPAAPDNTNGLQSVEISLSEQQLTDNVSFVGVVPFDIMFPVQGQYLDYVFDMRVERVQQRGVLYTCDCCVDVDQLLYTQIAYTVPPSTDWHGAGESSPTTSYANKSVLASWHATSIARTIGKTPVMQFDNFQSTVIPDEKGGVTYADLIRDVFGWSSRVPTHMINVFIRDDKIYFVQRGHKARLIDLTGTKHTIPIVTHELVRMTWGSTPWSKTETREIEKYRPPTTSASSSDTGDGSGSGSIGDGVSSISGGADKVIKYKGGGDQPATPVNDDGEEENVGVLEDGSSFVGYPESGFTRYRYNGRGLLIQTFTYVHNHETGKNTYTTVNQYYDGDGALVGSWTFVQSMDGHGDAAGYSSSSTTIDKGYIKLANGEKFLARESSITYTSDHSLTPTDLVESKTVIHSPSRAGQGRATVIEDGEFSGGIVGQNTGDDRVTPYRHGQAKKLAETALENSLKAAGKNTSGSGSETTAGGASTPEEIYNAYQANHEANYYTERQTRTLNGLSLYDSSFPIQNVGKLMELTEAIKWLNRRTKETVTMTIYEYPHLIDFNDRILFNGAQYFLVSNVAMTNARVFNEQRVTFTRWY